MDKKKLIMVIVLILLALAFIFRTINPQLNPATHVNVHGDEARVLTIARNVAERGQFAYSEGLSEYELSLPNAFWTGPLTVYTHAAFFYVFGSTYAVARLTVALFGFICIFLMYLITRKIYGKKAAIICAVLAALNPLFAFYSRIALHDILGYMFFMISVYLALNIENRTRLRMALIGVCAALASISRYNGIIILLIMVIYFAYTRRRKFLMDLPFLLIPCFLVFLGFYFWLVYNGFFELFTRTFFGNMFETGIMSKIGLMAYYGIIAVLQVLVKYAPFLLVGTIAGLLIIYKRGFVSKQEKLILIWIAVGFAWWLQSYASGKYMLAFTFPMFIFVSGALMKVIKKPVHFSLREKASLSEGKRIFRLLDHRHVMVFLVVMLSFYIAVNLEATYDIRDDSVYNTAAIIKASEERILFAEPPLAFVSGKSKLSHYWNDSYRHWVSSELHLEMFYNPPNNQSIYGYLEKTRPRYIMLSSKFVLKSATPRREFHHYIDLYGKVKQNIGSYVLYELTWPED